MFDRTQLERYARVLLWALDVSRGRPYGAKDLVALRYDPPAAPLAEVVYEALVELGVMAVVRTNHTAAMDRAFYHKAGRRQLTFIPPGEEEFNRALGGSIHLIAPESLLHLADVDPKRIAATARARRPLRDILEQREGLGEYGWTLCAHPTPELARAAGLSPEEYTAQIVRACRLDAADPVAQWRSVLAEMNEVRRWLDAMDMISLRVESAGTDLTVTPGEQRRWLSLTGHNIPSFETYLSPDWRGTEGVYTADLPSYRNGNIVRGVRLTFRQGRVVKAVAEDGEAFLVDQLNTDDGATRLGEFSLTDARFSRIDTFMAMTLFDENHGGEHGNCHVALGASYLSTFAGDPAGLTPEQRDGLGFNRSALHWDLVNTESKTVTARLRGGGHALIYEGGRFTL